MIPDGVAGTGSTSWVPKRGRILPSARGKTPHPRSGYRWFGLRCWDREEKLTLVIKYRGGPECWYLVEARGRHGVFPGIAALHDVMREVHQRG